MPTGMLTKKIQRQPISTPSAAMIVPPRIGPIAVEMPTVVPNSPKARPRSAPWNICWIRADTCGLSRPPPTPCSSRAATSTSADGASPARKLETVKTPTPMTNIRRRPVVSPRRPAETRTRPKVSA